MQIYFDMIQFIFPQYYFPRFRGYESFFFCKGGDNLAYTCFYGDFVVSVSHFQQAQLVLLLMLMIMT